MGNSRGRDDDARLVVVPVQGVVSCLAGIVALVPNSMVLAKDPIKTRVIESNSIVRYRVGRVKALQGAFTITHRDTGAMWSVYGKLEFLRRE